MHAVSVAGEEQLHEGTAQGVQHSAGPGLTLPSWWKSEGACMSAPSSSSTMPSPRHVVPLPSGDSAAAMPHRSLPHAWAAKNMSRRPSGVVASVGCEMASTAAALPMLVPPLLPPPDVSRSVSSSAVSTGLASGSAVALSTCSRSRGRSFSGRSSPPYRTPKEAAPCRRQWVAAAAAGCQGMHPTRGRWHAMRDGSCKLRARRLALTALLAATT